MNAYVVLVWEQGVNHGVSRAVQDAYGNRPLRNYRPHPCTTRSELLRKNNDAARDVDASAHDADVSDARAFRKV